MSVLTATSVILYIITATEIMNILVSGIHMITTAYVRTRHKQGNHRNLLKEITNEDMRYIMYLHTIKVYKVSNDNSSFAQLWLYSSDNHFEFTDNVLSSKMYYGEYEDTGNKIICRDRNTENFFTFKKSKGTLVFDEKNSSPLPKYNGVPNLEDGDIFTQ